MWDKHKSDGGVAAPVDFSGHMKKCRHEQIKHVTGWLFAEKDDQDEWWKISACVRGFNKSRQRTFWFAVMRVFDESMLAFRPRTAKKADLPRIFCVHRKCCTSRKTGIVLHLEIKKEGMQLQE